MKRILTLLLPLAAGALSAFAQTPCPTVTKSTKLAANCTAPLIVAADNVFVDLNSKTIFCPVGTYVGIEINGRRGVRVEDGTVINCVRGVNIVGGREHSLRRLTLKQMVAPSPDLVRYGVYVEGSTRNSFEAVQAENNSVGFDLTIGSFDNTFKGVKGIRNTLDGLQLDFDATDNLIRESTFSENARFGVNCGLRSARNVIMKSHIEKNGWVGVIPSSANVFDDNTVRANGFTHSNAWIRGGIVLFGSNNVIVNNEVVDNAYLGIAAGLWPNNVEAVANAIHKNNSRGIRQFTGFGAPWDFADFPSGQCALNSWKDNSGGLGFDGCEKVGDASDYRATGAGQSGGIAFQFHATRKEAGPAKGSVKVERMQVGGSLVKVEGSVSCLATQSGADGISREAIVGMIIDKSSHPALVPVYQTLHLFLTDSPLRAADGSPMDAIGLAPVNVLGPGECNFSLPQVQKQSVSKGKVEIDIKD